MFRFMIRDVLWLMVVVALGLGWWLEHGQSMERVAKVEIERDALAKQIRTCHADYNALSMAALKYGLLPTRNSRGEMALRPYDQSPVKQRSRK